MAQVTIYLDDDTLARMKAAASTAGQSMSSWLAALVREQTRATWPPEVVELAGVWDDLPDAAELRDGLPDDVPRETL